MKKRLQVTMHPDLLEAARKMAEARKFGSISELLESLIRDAWENRGPVVLPRELERVDLNDQKTGPVTYPPAEGDKPAAPPPNSETPSGQRLDAIKDQFRKRGIAFARGESKPGETPPTPPTAPAQPPTKPSPPAKAPVHQRPQVSRKRK